MDIKLSHQLLSEYLKTDVSAPDLAAALSLCGPTVDRMHQIDSDTIFDIEVITNRIDSVSAFGVAREAAAILQQLQKDAQLVNNPYDLKLTDLGDLPTNSPAKIQILNASLLPRLVCIALTNCQVKDSPPATQQLLTNSGLRPLNNLIDISNELTLRLGLPVHIFDLDKIEGHTLVLRESKKGEKITTLDGVTHTLRGGDIVVGDSQGRLIDLCGIMGGALSAVDATTRNILLFVPVYEPKHIRKTSLYTQNRSLAAQIYEKNPDPELALPTLITGVKFLKERAHATVSSAVFDYYPSPREVKHIPLDISKINCLIGLDLPEKTIIEILNSLGFPTIKEKLHPVCLVPSWRYHDINLIEDLAEEVARVYGYYRLPPVLPTTTLPVAATEADPLLINEVRAKEVLIRLGLTEVLTDSLISENQITHLGLKPADHLQLTNPLSEDFGFLRTSLLPGLLSLAAANPTLDDFRIFELSNIYLPTNQKLPQEISTLSLIFKNTDLPAGRHGFRSAKGILESFFATLHLQVEFIQADKQTAQVTLNDQTLGSFGYLQPQVLSRFGLKGDYLAADFNFQLLSTHLSWLHQGQPLPIYASVVEDITFDSQAPLGQLLQKIKGFDPLIHTATYLTSMGDKHTFRLEFNHPERNLTQAEVNQIKDRLLSSL